MCSSCISGWYWTSTDSSCTGKSSFLFAYIQFQQQFFYGQTVLAILLEQHPVVLSVCLLVMVRVSLRLNAHVQLDTVDKCALPA